LQRVGPELTFQQVRELIKDDQKDDRLLDAIDQILGAVLLLSPILIGTPGVPALGLIGAKNEAIKAVKGIKRHLTGKKKASFVERSAYINAAHCLLTYTAFFEALDDCMPEFYRKVALTSSDRHQITWQAVQKIKEMTSSAMQEGNSEHLDLTAVPIAMPHPVRSKEEETVERQSLYEQMTKGLSKVILGLSAWEQLADSEKDIVSTYLRELPERACDVYDAQYWALASEFPQFFIWADLREHARTQTLTLTASQGVQNSLTLVKKAVESIDHGLSSLASAINSMPGSQIVSSQASEVVRSLNLTYMDRISQPVIDDRYDRPYNERNLTYPQKHEIFIPQGYKALRYTNAQLRLEDEANWQLAKPRDDLGAFVIEYLESAYGTESPLLILGQPGSGKSLLTEILACRLSPPQFNAIRLELRDINVETDLQTQIEVQIRKDTGRDISWPTLAESFPDSPPVVILDGYDELLQASGKVHSAYLDEVHRFQRREAVQGLPVRVIITSRVTLIDKAIVPIGTSIVRLLEFDDVRRSQWIEVWNRHNSEYYRDAGTKPFKVDGSPKILQLSQQPLLLLMLAVYDSEENALHNNRGLDQTLLYYSLLCRFMERERLKGVQGITYRSLAAEQKKKLIEEDLARLGVVAIGMFNRESLHITREQLDRDVSYFGLERTVTVSEGGTHLSQADLLLGSFFFIHESRTKSTGDDPEATTGPTAFEFLHNTFGEFLVGDFILRNLLRETNTISKLRADTDLQSTLRQRLIQVNKEWFAPLSWTALYSRPVILEMMLEWVKHRLRMENRIQAEFLQDLDLLIETQIQAVLAGNPPPFLVERDSNRPFESLPLLAYVAIYSLNLVTVRTVLADGEYVFNEESCSLSTTGCRPWDRLVQLWRSWFPLESLSGLSSILASSRSRESVTIKPRKVFTTPPRDSWLDDIYNVASALADNTQTALAALQLQDSSTSRHINSNDVVQRARTEGIDLDLEFSIRDEQYRRQVDTLDEHARRIANMPDHYYSQDMVRALEIFGDPSRTSLASHLNIAIRPSQLESILSLPGHVARKIVEFKARFEPRWIDDLLIKLSPGNVSTILSSSTHIALLEASLLYPECRGSAHLGNILRSFTKGDVQATSSSSPDTIILLAALGQKLRVPQLYRQFVKDIHESALDSTLMVESISAIGLERLADLALSGKSRHKAMLSAVVDKVTEQLLEARRSGEARHMYGQSSTLAKLALACKHKSRAQRRLIRAILRMIDHPGYMFLTRETAHILIRILRATNDTDAAEHLFSRWVSPHHDGEPNRTQGDFWAWLLQEGKYGASHGALIDMLWLAKVLGQDEAAQQIGATLEK